MRVGNVVTQTEARTQTVLDALIDALRRAGSYHPDAEVPPTAILWPDGARQWAAIVPALRDHLEVLTLGDYEPDTDTGPAIWIRAELATRETADQPPIVYLPGVSRDVLRNVEEAPNTIEPLLYLQYRGSIFLQPNGKDWTLAAFLQNAQYGLGLQVDRAEATRQALITTAGTLASRPVAELRNHAGGIDADFLYSIILDDVPRLILDWIDDPAGVRARLDDATWTAFCKRLTTVYGVDPERDGPAVAAQRLGESKVDARWDVVWNRFAEAPSTWPNVPDRLQGAKPASTAQRGLFDEASTLRWPQDNEAQEAELRSALLALASQPVETAREEIASLAVQHAPRRETVWAKLDKAPLALALEHLANVARMTAEPFPAGSIETMRRAYTEHGWLIDAAAIDAATAVTTRADRDAVDAALHAVYVPWLWSTAERFQDAIVDYKMPADVSPLSVSAGTCVLFADGLRYDLGARLAERLRASGIRAEVTGDIGPLPGVTPSAKPAQSPVTDQLIAGKRIEVAVESTGTTLNQPSFRRLIEQAGWSFIGSEGAGKPDAAGTAWTELGSIDSYGHNHPRDLPQQVDREIGRLAQRVRDLLEVGWERVMIITDHGWLLTPKPMEKTDLPQHLTVERKGRCARLNAGASTGLQTVPWCWDPDVRIAMAPGISCFEAGKRYDHGGLSLQECVIPTIIATTTGESRRAAVAIAEVGWRGLRCQVEITGDPAGMTVDIRQKAADASTSLTVAPQPVSEDGTARVLIEDDAYEGYGATIVVLDSQGTPSAQQATIVGGE